MTGTELADLASRVLPVLAFLVAITVVAEIADLAGVFDVAAHWASRAGRHRIWALWLLIVAIACACTIVLSLDTTAVLLTPVAITVARQVGVPPLPFAMTTLWLANTASLLLPVSNLTNLLALHHMTCSASASAGTCGCPGRRRSRRSSRPSSCSRCATGAPCLAGMRRTPLPSRTTRFCSGSRPPAACCSAPLS